MLILVLMISRNSSKILSSCNEEGCIGSFSLLLHAFGTMQQRSVVLRLAWLGVAKCVHGGWYGYRLEHVKSIIVSVCMFLVVYEMGKPGSGLQAHKIEVLLSIIG